MKFKLEIELGNDAMHTGYDIAVALRRLAREVEPIRADSEEFGKIRDLNGNAVGSWEVK